MPADLGQIITSFKAQFETSASAKGRGSADVSADEIGEAASAKTLATE